MQRVCATAVMGVQACARVHSKRTLNKMHGPRMGRRRKPEPELGNLRWIPVPPPASTVGVYGWAPPTGAVPEDLPFKVGCPHCMPVDWC